MPPRTSPLRARHPPQLPDAVPPQVTSLCSAMPAVPRHMSVLPRRRCSWAASSCWCPAQLTCLSQPRWQQCMRPKTDCSCWSAAQSATTAAGAVPGTQGAAMQPAQRMRGSSCCWLSLWAPPSLGACCSFLSAPLARRAPPSKLVHLRFRRCLRAWGSSPPPAWAGVVHALTGRACASRSSCHASMCGLPWLRLFTVLHAELLASALLLGMSAAHSGCALLGLLMRGCLQAPPAGAPANATAPANSTAPAGSAGQPAMSGLGAREPHSWPA